MNHLKEGDDFYYSEEGYVVFTEKYHLEKGSCCGNGCRHCPYGYINVPDAVQKEKLSGNKVAALTTPGNL